MKLFFLLCSLFLLSSVSFASDPNYCHGQSNSNACLINKAPWYSKIFTSKTAYARGFGKNCEEAVDAADRNFDRYYNAPASGCGIFTGPYSMGCNQIGKNRFSAWTICPPSSSGKSYSGPKCVMIFGVLSC